MDSVANGVEVWKVIPVAPNYEASSLGRVRNSCTGNILGGKITRWGYRQVSIMIGDQRKHCQVHRLIAMAFISMPPEGRYNINHKNSTRTDNRPENLEWVSQYENTQHAIQYGNRQWNGEENPCSKLTDEQVLQIMDLKGKESACQIGRRFKVSSTLIGFIHKGRLWRSLTSKHRPELLSMKVLKRIRTPRSQMIAG